MPDVLEPLDPSNLEDSTYAFHCPGCGCSHYVRVKGPSGCVWGWNGDKVKPTFTPSILVCKDEPERRCHMFVRDGTIEYLSDCWHALKGTTAAMSPWHRA